MLSVVVFQGIFIASEAAAMVAPGSTRLNMKQFAFVVT